MGKITESALELVGKTPLLRASRYAKNVGAEQADVLVKLEYLNPAGSVKDRIALAMIEDAEKNGILKPGATIIEPTSGNTGIGLAAVAAAKGYKAILTLPETMSVERRNLLKAYGAELVLTEGAKGMKGAIAKAEELRDSIPGAVILGQFVNKANPAAHKATTGPEIWEQTGTKEFRDLVGEIATLLCYEATRDLPLEEVEIETPITMAKTKVLAGRKLALVPILRAGMGMLDGMLTLLPAAKVGFIGLYRDEETLQPVEYFCKLPKDIAERDVLVLDPMLATGGSAIDAITQIKKHGAKHIKFIGLIAAPEGIKALHEAHPDVDIYLGAQDDHLNENGYIVPGLGDAGDRIYGTK